METGVGGAPVGNWAHTPFPISSHASSTRVGVEWRGEITRCSSGAKKGDGDGLEPLPPEQEGGKEKNKSFPLKGHS